MFFSNPLGSARPAVGPYRKGLLGEEQGAEGATAQKQLHETRGFPLLQTIQMHPANLFAQQELALRDGEKVDFSLSTFAGGKT